MFFTTEISSHDYRVCSEILDDPLVLLIIKQLSGLLDTVSFEQPYESAHYDLYITTPSLFSAAISAKRKVLIAYPNDVLPMTVPKNTYKVIFTTTHSGHDRHSNLVMHFYL
ncbi:MAG: hypothetical protein UZ21_OP11001000834 [Microgenomates bacterium OLB22]|nr:MAG: hypothetical protein UZ21_OP11001000834 [Microgenomates bacterium OLB22]